MGQSSQFHPGSRIHIVKISSNFYILLVSLREASPENFSSISLFVQILWPFEYFRVHLIFRVLQIFSILGSNHQKFLNLQNFGRQSLKYMPSSYKKQFRTQTFKNMRFFCGCSKISKRLETQPKKLNINFFLILQNVFNCKWLIQSVSVLKP